MSIIADSTLASAVRHLERAFEAAAIVAAIVSAHVSDDSPFAQFRERQNELLRDVLHDFAFHARKSIEHASTADGSIRQAAQDKTVFGIKRSGAPSPTNFLGATEAYSLFFVLGGLVYSDEFAIVRERIDEDPISVPWRFTVQSDRDLASDAQHQISIEAVLEAF